jgi:hypothetical protein
MTDTRKPFAPDRPGIYVLRDGEVATILGKDAEGEWISMDGCSWPPSGQWLSSSEGPSDIVGRHESDADWCLAQARALIAAVPGYEVIRKKCERCGGWGKFGILNQHKCEICDGDGLMSINVAERQEGSK